MKKLLKYLKDYKKESILGPLFKMLEATLELIVPLVVAAIIDNGIGSSDKGYIARMSLVMIALGLVGLGFSATAQYFAAKASVGFVKKIRYALFQHIGTLSYTELDKIGTSTIITRLTSDINQVQNGVNLTLRLFLRSPFVVFGSVIMAFTIDFRSAAVFAVSLPILAAVVFGIMLVCIPLYKKVQRALDAVLLKTRENLTGVRVIRAFRREEDEKNEFEVKNNELADISKYVGRISALMNPVTYVIINFAIVFLIKTGAVQVAAGAITQGAVIALYNYMSQILVELIKLANLIITITKSVACGNRINDILETKPGMVFSDTMPKTGGEYSVRFKNVYFKYSGSPEYALSNINFDVKRGETVGIIGGTGSGKTTLVNMIPRFYDVTDGQVFADGADVRDYPADELRKKIGIVPQRAVLFSGTVRENMRWGNENATDAEIYEALSSAMARDFIDEKPGGLDFVLEQGGRNLSGGQRQRLTIARALVRKPEILILDDSASALDYATDAALRKSLKKLKNTTVFIVSQRTSSIMHADKIVVLEDGGVAGIGTHDSLLKSCGIYKEIYNSQFDEEVCRHE